MPLWVPATTRHTYTRYRDGYVPTWTVSAFAGLISKGTFAPAPKITGTRKVGQKLTATLA